MINLCNIEFYKILVCKFHLMKYAFPLSVYELYFY